MRIASDCARFFVSLLLGPADAVAKNRALPRWQAAKPAPEVGDEDTVRGFPIRAANPGRRSPSIRRSCRVAPAPRSPGGRRGFPSPGSRARNLGPVGPPKSISFWIVKPVNGRLYGRYSPASSFTLSPSPALLRASPTEQGTGAEHCRASPSATRGRSSPTRRRERRAGKRRPIANGTARRMGAPGDETGLTPIETALFPIPWPLMLHTRWPSTAESAADQPRERPPAGRAAARIASSGASRPVHASSERAPWRTRTSIPSTVCAPAALAAAQQRGRLAPVDHVDDDLAGAKPVPSAGAARSNGSSPPGRPRSS